jgi:hypothetical protein
MPFPKSKGTNKADRARQPKPGVPLTKTVEADTVRKLLEQEKGNISQVADIIGTCRGTLRRMIDNDPMLQDTLKQCRERLLDQLEDSVFTRSIEAQDTTLQLFLLKTQGKSRGYDQDEARHAAKEVANAAFEFIISKTKSVT